MIDVAATTHCIPVDARKRGDDELFMLEWSEIHGGANHMSRHMRLGLMFVVGVVGTLSLQVQQTNGADPVGLDARMGMSFPITVNSRAQIKSPLLSAITEGDTISAIDLIAQGVDVNEKLGGCITPLMVSASMGQTSVVQQLVAKGADVAATNRQGRTALMFAALQGHAPVVEILVRAGSSVHARDAQGCTPLILGVMSRNTKVVVNLFDAGGEVNAQDEMGMTALMWAVSSGLDEIALFLLSKQTDPTVINKQGLAAHDYARITRNPGMQEKLEAAGKAWQEQISR